MVLLFQVRVEEKMMGLHVVPHGTAGGGSGLRAEFQ